MDGLRGIAILAVLFFHADILAVGWMGVQLFFVLSGFLITRILMQSRSEPAATYFGGFYWRRTLRIFPLYFGFLGAAALLILFTGRPVGAADHLPTLLTYTFNFDRALVQDPDDLFFRPLWSLSFEEQFYLVWPLLVWVSPMRVMRVLVLALILSAPLLRYTIGLYGAGMPDAATYLGPLTYCFPLGHLDAFAFGALLVVFPLTSRVARPQRWLALAALLFVAAGLLNAWAGGAEMGAYLIPALGYPVASVANGLHIWGYSLENLLFAALVLLAIHPAARGHWLNRVFQAGWLVWVGRISYGVYVLHWPVIVVWGKLMPFDGDWGLRLMILLPVMAVILFLAWLSHRYFESWFLRFRGKRDTTNE